MADVNVVADSTAQPPVNEISVNSLGLFDSIQISRIQDNVETLIRSQPNKGVSNALAYDYEAKYGIPVQYHVTGIEKNTSLSSTWSGTANASSSTLSKDGSVVATNLLVNPNPRSSGKFNSIANGTVVDVDNGVRLTPTNVGTKANVNMSIPKPVIPAGDYVLVASLKYSGSTWYDYVVYCGDVYPNIPTSSLTSNPQNFVIPFTTSRDGVSGGNVQFKTPYDGWTEWSNIGLFTASDWQAMQSLDIDWFSGDSYVLGSTSQFDILTDPVALTPQYGWLIHPANPAKSMQLPRGRITGFTDIGRAANATRHDVMGASLPVYTINGSRFGMEFTLELKTRSFDEESMLWALLNDQIPVLINWLDADAQRLNLSPMFVQVGDVTQARFVQQVYADSDESYPDHWRTWQLPCVQIQSPAISQQTAVWTYLGLLNEQSSYLNVQAAYATYADVQAHSLEASNV
ncbi:MAG: hypothetical protein ABF524_07380 [Bifidobacterium aquikefiri]